ncbi:helix-turn-helix domain-containing protein [Limoniibacter endophyticus]|uniref:Chromosomal replication initiator DnaA C-terminal domain-containing protein n=1 Tax=Limoniibacter endophyticus TaxID=1565040 RepID=A0A8J3DP18_9HYPH|nr:helix-turn-helix domain-containing protein [Limoniibacter endophyticus]GHC69593.1 hypothetical protein GCM10010136_15590 [Limoniibacter endophyticus]
MNSGCNTLPTSSSPVGILPGKSNEWPTLRHITSKRRKQQACEAMADITAAIFNISSTKIRSGERSLDISRIRQIAMYVSHVALGLSMSEVGKGFGRDRTTVLHACQVIEELRDDPQFDELITMAERVACAAVRFHGEQG